MSTIRKSLLPYAILPARDGSFWLVNRGYQRLTKVGFGGLTPAKAARIGLFASEHGKSYHLYDDYSMPEKTINNWARYQAILFKLMKLEIKPAERGPVSMAEINA